MIQCYLRYDIDVCGSSCIIVLLKKQRFEGTSGRVVVEVNVKQVEYDTEHGGSEAVTQASHTRYHALGKALLVRVRVHRHEGRNRRVSDGRDRG